ncbi:MAG: XRE family transcriptional regulator [Methanobrevibacter sp.]|jgi:transcriptional regulator with XRE-family HTH domain|nr:XRE family transcriptional regulator [Candidatus Methanoflexus mossambicus]
MDKSNQIGEKIKILRNQKNLTIEQLAKKSKVNIKLVESIENGEVFPSLSPLMKISDILGVRLGTFLDDDTTVDPIFIKKGNSSKVMYFSGDEKDNTESALEFYSLASGKNDRHMEPFIIDVHTCSDDFDLSSHEGEEFIYVLDGAIELKYGKNEYIITKGDSIYYDSIVPHNLHSYKNESSKILAVVYTPFD